MNKLYFLIGLLIIQPFCFGKYYSQFHQDEYVREHYFSKQFGGVFVDIGAHNGVDYSNTLFFEKELGWTGLCIEPLPERFEQLKKCRNCICIQGCISDSEGTSQFLKVSSPSVNTEMLSGLVEKYDPQHLKRIETEIKCYDGSSKTIEVKTYLLNSLLKKYGFSHINFLSIDTEGGEFDILSSIDFSQFKIDVIAVEDNYQDSRFIIFLQQRGYSFVRKLGCDLLFVHKDLHP